MGKRTCRMASILQIIGLLCGAAALIGCLTACNALKELSSTKIENIDLTKVVDGTYEATRDYTLVTATVTVTVKDHVITDIKLKKHKHGRRYSGEKIIDRVIQAQSLEVDAVSGATGSSTCILKAIEDALRQGLADRF